MLYFSLVQRQQELSVLESKNTTWKLMRWQSGSHFFLVTVPFLWTQNMLHLLRVWAASYFIW